MENQEYSSYNQEDSGKRKIPGLKIGAAALGILLLAALLLSVYYGGPGKAYEALTGVFREDVVAVVNGEEITGEDYDTRLDQVKMDYRSQYGMDLESADMEDLLEAAKEQLLEQMINNLLIEQQIEKEGLEVSEEDVEERYNAYVEHYGGEDNLRDNLGMMDLSEEELEDIIRQEVGFIKYVDFVLEEKEFTVSEEEKKELYQVYADQIDEDYQEVEEELEEMLRGEKESQAFSQHMEELREESEIDVRL